MTKILTFSSNRQSPKDIPGFHVGDIVRVHQRIKEVSEAGKEKERIQIFEGLVIAKKHGATAGATFTVRKISSGVGVERIFPLHSPLVEKVEVAKKQAVIRSKLYYVRGRLASDPTVKKHGKK